MAPRYCCYMGTNESVGTSSLVRCMLGLLSGQICWMGLRFQTLMVVGWGGGDHFQCSSSVLSVVCSSPIVMVTFLIGHWNSNLFNTPSLLICGSRFTLQHHPLEHSAELVSYDLTKLGSSPWFQMSKLFRSTYEEWKHLFGWGKNSLELFSLFLWLGRGKVLVVLLQSADRGRSWSFPAFSFHTHILQSYHQISDRNVILRDGGRYRTTVQYFFSWLI